MHGAMPLFPIHLHGAVLREAQGQPPLLLIIYFQNVNGHSVHVHGANLGMFVV